MDENLRRWNYWRER